MVYKIGDHISLDQALDFSLEIASKGLGLVEPNPCVGSVLIDEKSNKLISFGHHQKYGGPHAEVNCLESVETAEGLTLIVSLEPCSHYGKTPPCADLVIQKKPKKLIYVTKDPNPLVAGKGLQKIKEAGIEVEQAGSKHYLKNRRINHKFFYSFENKKSYIHLKWAESADGKTAVKEGSPWITNEKSREHAHFLRAQSQAVLIGRGTLEKDDPSLNVRLKDYEKALSVIVFDPSLKSLSRIEAKKVSQVREKKNVIFLCEEIPDDKKDYSFLKLHKNLEGDWNLNRLSRDLYSEFGFQSVFVEGGARTVSEFIKQRAHSRVSVYKSKKKLGSLGEKEVKGFSDYVYESETVCLYSEKIELEEDLLEDFYFN